MPSYSGIFTLPAQMQAKAAGHWPAPPPTVGQAYEGGFYVGQIGVSGTATHKLVAAPLSSGQFQGQWKNVQSATPGADSVINGPQNTLDIVADGNSTVYPCAHFCNNAVIGGFSDWYMPAKNELEICYFNLKPTTENNNTSSGINPNAVPARATNYTVGNPAQTSAANFKDTGSEYFSAAGYWSSTKTPFSVAFAYGTYFNSGRQAYYGKTIFYRTRAVRRVPV